MNTEENNQNVVVGNNNEGEGETGENQQETETISVSKTEYEKLNQTLGSLKRELKDLRKSKEDSSKETPKTNTESDSNRLVEKLERMSLRQAGITHQDDIDLARSTAKKWGMDLDEVLVDDDFKMKLERQQSARDNLVATSKIKGGGGTSQAKNTPEYWIAKGTPPTVADVPDRKLRATIARAMMSNSKSGRKFYND